MNKIIKRVGTGQLINKKTEEWNSLLDEARPLLKNKLDEAVRLNQAISQMGNKSVIFDKKGSK
jgi:hypothetical protein